VRAVIEWSDEERQMQAAVREFVQKEVVPRRDDLEHGDLAPYDVLRSYVRTFGLDEIARERFERERNGPPFTTQERYDRAVMTLLPMVEFCRHCPGLITAMGVSMNLAGNAVKKGTPEQRERWALPLLTLDKVGAWAITEPDSGSDAFGGMRSSAVRDGDTFVLNGSKTFITNGPHADTTVFICKLDDGVTPARERRVLSFILDRGMPGFEQSPPLRKMGLHSSPTGQLFLTDVEVGVDRLIGGAASLGAASSGAGDQQAGDGRRSRDAARAAFASERASIAAMALA
jgi:alkylation response protein AidB-like acyl-CoA dehydrogenase